MHLAQYKYKDKRKDRRMQEKRNKRKSHQIQEI